MTTYFHSFVLSIICPVTAATAYNHLADYHPFGLSAQQRFVEAQQTSGLEVSPEEGVLVVTERGRIS